MGTGHELLEEGSVTRDDSPGPEVYVLKTQRGTITVPASHLNRVDHFPSVLTP